MSWYICYVVPVLIHLLSVARGVLIVGPTRIFPNEKYTIVLSNYFNSSVDLSLALSKTYNDPEASATTASFAEKNLNIGPNMNELVDFKIPANLSHGNYKLTVAGQRGFNFHEEIKLILERRIISGLIQLNKPVFKPGDTVLFRVIMLDFDLKPPKNLLQVTVAIENGKGLTIHQWDAAPLHIGVFEGSFSIAPASLLGTYKITVSSDGKELISNTFEVKEYMLSTFDVDVFPTTIPLEENQGVNLTVSAKDVFGHPVRGTVDITLFEANSLMNVRTTREVDGKAQITMWFKEGLDVYEDSKDINLNFTFTKKHTYLTVSKSLSITIFKSMYRATLIRETQGFFPGHPFKATVKVEFQDGSPAKHVECHLEVDGIEENYDRKFTTDDSGEIPLELIPSDGDIMIINVSIGDNELLEETIEKTSTPAFMKISLLSDIKHKMPIQLKVTCHPDVKFLVYLVLAKGSIIDQGFMWLNNSNQPIELKYSKKMIPTAKVLVATVFADTIVYDIKELRIPYLANNFDMELESVDVRPEELLNLHIIGRPSSYVALAAYDKNILKYGSNHDVYLSTVKKLYEIFYRTEQNEYDAFQSIGLFVRVSGNMSLKTGAVARERYGAFRELIQYRSDFVESFLWINTTLDKSGKLNLQHKAPASITSWYLTGFSMHPVYGLGIINEPLQLNTIKIFYIVDHLPSYIKQGEVVALQFTIFNNLGFDFISTITLFNVRKQLEFIERPSEATHLTKYMTTQANSNLVSFLVKAKRPGELLVRVEVANMIDSDAIQKMISVIP